VDKLLALAQGYAEFAMRNIGHVPPALLADSPSGLIHFVPDRLKDERPKGEIAALSGGQDDPRYFQISVPLQPGNSGGALVDERGNVVGVVAAKLSAAAALAASGTLPENVNYAVKTMAGLVSDASFVL